MTRLSKEFREMSNVKIWNQLWQPVHSSLDAIMDETNANYYSKHFFGQHHLKALVPFQLTDGQSLEDLHQSLSDNLHFKTLTHCPPISKSQLSRANAKRPLEAFEQVFLNLAQQLPRSSKLPKSLQELIDHTRIFDGTFLPLHPTHCPWAIYRNQFRQPDAGLRMTLRLNLKTYAPDQIFIHPYRDNSANYFSNCINFDQKGYLYLFDREFNHHQTFQRLCDSENFFITRMKERACYEILQTRSTPKRTRCDLKILKDQTICLGKKVEHRIPAILRRIEAQDAEGNVIVFLTNLLTFAASTLAQLYRFRWKIETFFKWIKQHLKIKRFIAYSMRGILLQIYSALILYLLLVLFRINHQISLSLFNVLRKLKNRMNTISPIVVLKFKLLEPSLALVKQSLMPLPYF